MCFRNKWRKIIRGGEESSGSSNKIYGGGQRWVWMETYCGRIISRSSPPFIASQLAPLSIVSEGLCPESIALALGVFKETSSWSKTVNNFIWICKKLTLKTKYPSRVLHCNVVITN